MDEWIEDEWTDELDGWTHVDVNCVVMAIDLYTHINIYVRLSCTHTQALPLLVTNTQTN